MRTRKRSVKLAAFAVGLALVAAACGDDDDDNSSDTTAAGGTETTAADTETTGGTEAPDGTETAGTEGATGEAAMRVTYTIADGAAWNDGSPITWEDFECRWQAAVNTPESINTTGYDQIVAVTEGDEPNTVFVDFGAPFAGWKTLFASPGLLQVSQHEDCADVSQDFSGAYTYGSGPFVMTSWTPEQIIFDANPDYTGARTPKAERIVVVPAEDGPTLLKAGSVDFIYPQSYAGIEAELADPNIEFDAEPSGQFEGFYFNQDPACTPDDTRSCAFADADYREAFSKAIDLPGVYDQIYAPFAAGLPLLDCGPIAPGPYCDPVFVDTYDPEGAVTVLEEAGWTKGGDGLWANPEGDVPEVHWMVSSGNTRRESTQDFLIPKLREAGFNVIADNCEALPCVFETRLPALQYDMSMHINVVAPDPSYLSSLFTCEQVPSPENDFQGQNSVGWCNEESSAKFTAADRELDEDARITLVKEAIASMVDDHVMLPTLQFPNVGAYRTDKTAGTQNNLANFDSFDDWWNFEDLDGDGQVVIGAEQFPTPDCVNPITSCANSSWFFWVTSNHQFPDAYDPTNDQLFVPGEILAGEAEVTEL